MNWKRILACGLTGVMLAVCVPSTSIAAEVSEGGFVETVPSGEVTRAVNQTINGLEVTFHEPETGKTLVNPEILSTASGTHFTTVGDRAANPATLTQNPNSRKATNITFADGIWGYSGEIMAANSGTNNSKFDVSGTTPLIIRFKMKSDRVTTGTISGSENKQAVQLLGKMDEQYGVQLMQDAVIIYAHDNADGWVESRCAIDSSFWSKWHEVMVVFTGTKMQVYVDGKAGSASEGRPNAESSYSVALKSYSNSVFTTGYNKEKKDSNKETDYMPYEGLLSDIELFSGTDYTSGLTKSYAAVSGALDEATPKFDLTLKPYRAYTKWYKNNVLVASGASCTANAAYKSVTTLTAYAGYQFADNVSIADAQTEVSNSNRTLTITRTYGDTAETERQALKKELDEAKGLNVEEYSEESRSAFEKAIQDAEAAYSDRNASMEELKAARDALSQAKLALKTPEEEKQEKAAAAKEEITVLRRQTAELNQEDFGEESWKRLLDANANAEKVCANADASPEEILAARDALKEALVGLLTRAEEEILLVRKDLEKALADAAKLIAEAGNKNYSDDAWKTFVAAWQAAKDAPDNADAAALRKLLVQLQRAQSALDMHNTQAKPAAPSIKSLKAKAGKKCTYVTVTVNKSEGADHYIIYRMTGGQPVKVGTTKSGKTVLKDKTLTKKSARYYAVAVAADGKTLSEQGAAVNITLPKAPAVRKVSAVSNGIKINWKKVKGAKSYVIYRSAKKKSGYVKVKKVSGKMTSCVDTKAKKGKSYYYKVAVVKRQASLQGKASKKVKR